MEFKCQRPVSVCAQKKKGRRRSLLVEKIPLSPIPVDEIDQSPAVVERVCSSPSQEQKWMWGSNELHLREFVSLDQLCVQDNALKGTCMLIKRPCRNVHRSARGSNFRAALSQGWGWKSLIPLSRTLFQSPARGWLISLAR